MRWLLGVLVVLVLILQYRLWIADGSLAEVHRLQSQIDQFNRENAQLRARNAVLEREVQSLKSGHEALEQRAREQLNLVREGEVFYQVGEPDEQGKPGAAAVKQP